MQQAVQHVIDTARSYLMSEAYGWVIQEDAAGTLHVMPTMEDHLFVDCPCHPAAADGIVTHNSFDGREAFERGERKRS